MEATLVDSADNMALPQSGNMSPIARQYLSSLNSAESPTLPGCTANEATEKPSMISNLMLQAYVAMRGPSAGFGIDPNDPLLEWSLFGDGLGKQGVKKTDAGEKDIQRMMSIVDRVLQSDGCLEDSPLTTEFEYQRHPSEHIQPPHDMDLSMHMLNACCADFEFEENESDEEDHVSRGRISPCTFLAWSRGCTSWKDDQPQLPDPEALSNTHRQRPESPAVTNTPPDKMRPNRWPIQTTDQECVESGLPLSPHYLVPTSPSILWVAEGIDSNRMNWKPDFEDHYSRMDHKAAKKLRGLNQFGRPGSGKISPASKSEHYTHSEVDKVVADKLKELDPTTDTQGAQTHISNQYGLIDKLDAESKKLYSEIEEQTLRIRELEHEREVVQLAAYNVKNKRAEEKAKHKSQPQEEQKRRQTVFRHFRTHLDDIDYKYTRNLARLEQERGKKNHNEDRIRGLEYDITKACEQVGKQDPGELYEELWEAKSTYRVRDPSLEPQTAVQFGSEYT